MSDRSALRTTFFTCANRAYELYVLPYMTSVLVHNRDARVEVCLESSTEFADANAKALGILERAFGERFLLRDTSTSEHGSVPPNSVRFLEVPEVVLPYTYIGDIDILCLESVSEQHLRRMDDTGLPYSNVLRPGKPALSGLHFSRSEAFYPQRLPEDADLRRDERLLYQLVVSRGWDLPDPDDRWRPVHGFHMTLNRAPLSNPGWSVRAAFGGRDVRFEAYRKLPENSVWQEMLGHFDERYVRLLGLVDLALAAQVSQLERRDVFTPDHGLALLADPRLVQSIVRREA